MIGSTPPAGSKKH